MKWHGTPWRSDAEAAGGAETSSTDWATAGGGGAGAAQIARLLDGLRMPTVMAVQCEGTLTSGQLYDQMTISSGPEWLYSVQSMRHGSVGFVATTVRHSTLERSTVYHTDRRVGHVDNRLGEFGGVEEDIFSPQFAARSARWALAHEPGHVSILNVSSEVVAIRREIADSAARTMFIDRTTGECREMRIGEAPSPVVRVVFADWRPIDGAQTFRHPASATVLDVRDGRETPVKTLNYTKVEALATGTAIPELALPEKARLEMKATGEVVDGAGQVVGHMGAPAAASVSGWPFSPASTLTASAVVVLMVAVTIWRRRG